MYQKCTKRILDIVLSFLGLILLLPVFLIVSLAIVIDDPGPVFFSQKRIGKNKKLFRLHKFRSMKRSTPHDVPTHLLDNPERYVTRVGRFMRRSSMDELPQIWDILRGKMSIVGPRPALWNQDDLVELRERLGANSLRPGLTGWAQINGRDELPLEQKAALDGVYAEAMKKGGRSAFRMDLRCFFGSFLPVLRGDGIVQNGPATGMEMGRDESRKE